MSAWRSILGGAAFVAALGVARVLSGRESRVADAPVTNPAIYRWRCACGAHSRGGDYQRFEADANAERHRLSKPVGHPTPEVYVA